MDRKHAMLYPDSSTIPVDERRSASASIGLPTEAPPSYDIAIGTVERNNTTETGCLSPAFKSDEQQSPTQENSLQIRDAQPITNNTRNAVTSYQSEASTVTTGKFRYCFKLFIELNVLELVLIKTCFWVCTDMLVNQHWF